MVCLNDQDACPRCAGALSYEPGRTDQTESVSDLTERPPKTAVPSNIKARASLGRAGGMNASRSRGGHNTGMLTTRVGTSRQVRLGAGGRQRNTGGA